MNSTGAAEALLHLGGMPVIEQPVGDEVLVHRAEVEGVLRGPPAPRHPACGVDDERRHGGGIGVGNAGDGDGARLDQRGEGENGRRRVTPRGGDQVAPLSSPRCSSGSP